MSEQPIERHGRRVDDLINQVQLIVDEVDEYLRTGKGGPARKKALMQAQSAALAALNKAMDMQAGLLDQVASGQALPARRASDVDPRQRMRSVEDQFFADLRRRAGLNEGD